MIVNFVPCVATLACWIVARAVFITGPTQTPPSFVNRRDLDGGLKGGSSRQMVEPTTPPWTPSPGNEFKTNLGLHGQAGFAKRFEREIMPL